MKLLVLKKGFFGGVVLCANIQQTECVSLKSQTTGMCIRKLQTQMQFVIF